MHYLIGERVTLRLMEQEDLEYAADWANDSEVTRYMYLGTFPTYWPAMYQEYLEMAAALPGNLTQKSELPVTVMFTICRKGSNVPIGWLGLFDIDWLNRIAEFRAILGDKSCWGEGYALDAYRLALGYGFDRLNLRKITGGQRADNYAAIKAARKVGFVQEGLLREHFLRNGQAYDIIVNGVLREEFYALFPSMAPQPSEQPESAMSTRYIGDDGSV